MARVSLPRQLQWDHNAYYHRWLLRQVPAGVGSVLDVGCGDGELARSLAARARRVDALDRSPVMIDVARSRSPSPPNIRWILGDVLDEPHAADLDAGYDTVTAVSSVHHMPLITGLTRLAGLVNPGGVLIIIGLYRPSTRADAALQALALPANLLVGLALAARGRAGRAHDVGMPVVTPATTLAEIRSAAELVLGRARLRRRLFWRYSLMWRRPPTTP